MGTKTYGKLVRDRIPEIIRSKGGTPRVRTLDEAAARRSLKLKLLEEAQELSDAQTPDEIAEELADVLEVASAIADANGIGMGDLSARMVRKRLERGGFASRTYLESVDEEA